MDTLLGNAARGPMIRLKHRAYDLRGDRRVLQSEFCHLMISLKDAPTQREQSKLRSQFRCKSALNVVSGLKGRMKKSDGMGNNHHEETSAQVLTRGVETSLILYVPENIRYFSRKQPSLLVTYARRCSPIARGRQIGSYPLTLLACHEWHLRDLYQTREGSQDALNITSHISSHLYPPTYLPEVPSIRADDIKPSLRSRASTELLQAAIGQEEKMYKDAAICAGSDHALSYRVCIYKVELECNRVLSFGRTGTVKTRPGAWDSAFDSDPQRITWPKKKRTCVGGIGCTVYCIDDIRDSQQRPLQ
nr:hypothetical protein CFP56_74511 [Quercus suber]